MGAERCTDTLQKSCSKACRGGVGVVTEHCSDDVGDIFDTDTKEEREQRPDKRGEVVNYFSENENGEQNGLCGLQGWKFQTEVLKTECNLLRMEKEVAAKRWEEGRSEMERTVRTAHPLHSAVQTLVAGRKGIADEKNYAETVLQTYLQSQIEALQDKLQKLQKNSEFREYELRKYRNCDCQKSDKEENAALRCRQGSFLEGQQIAEAKLRTHGTSNIKKSLPGQQNHLADAPMLRRRLNSLLPGMNKSKKTAVQQMKEYRTVLSSSGNCNTRRMDTPERAEQGSSQENMHCSEHCKATMQKIAEQVQSETHQWSQMQEILHNVHEEVEDLQQSKDFWEDHALHADEKIAILQAAMHEWRRKALSCENKVLNLQSEVIQLRNAVEQAKDRHALEQTIWLDAHTRSTWAVIPSISAKSSTACTIDSENLEHHEAYVDAAEISNQSGEKEKVDHHTKSGKDETKDSWHVPIGSPLMRSERTSSRICKATQSFNISSHHQSPINKDSKLNRPDSCPQSSVMHFRPNDCIAEQLSEEKFMKEIHICNYREDITVQNRLLHRENMGNWDQMNRHQDHLGSGKSSSGSIRLPLADIGNGSPF